MKTLLSLFLICLFYFANYAQETKVLFLGNSYTHVNDLPTILVNLSNSMGHNMLKDQNTPGGCRLMGHVSNLVSMNKIRTGGWDFVIIQAQSQEPSRPPAQIENEVFPYAKILSNTVRYYNSCAEILFFDTWGRKNGDSQSCEEWPPVCSFEGMNDRLLAGYYTMAKQNNASMAPVGIAWRLAREDGMMDNINLYSNDGSHPSVYGSYLSACVMYISIFKEPIHSDFYFNLPVEEALYLQSVANSVFDNDFEYVFNDTYTNTVYTMNKNAYFEYGLSVLANFSYTQTEGNIIFTNQSINHLHSEWSLGNGEVLQEEHPSYLFTDGTYNVNLSVWNNCFTDNTNDTIVVQTPDNIINTEAKKVRVIQQGMYLLIDQIEDIDKIEVFDTSGRLLDTQFTKFKNHIKINTLKHNSLILRLTNHWGKAHSKIITL